MRSQIPSGCAGFSLAERHKQNKKM
uniref:Uncharacterized protein n=1 Tax=Anguilla anguilla TaxID=7936 RepID=A0A0E9PMT9_ANGAN